MPAALTLILTCPSLGSRCGTPAHFSTSGGPYPVITTAWGIAVPSGQQPRYGRERQLSVSVCAVSCSTDSALKRLPVFPAPTASQTFASARSPPAAKPVTARLSAVVLSGEPPGQAAISGGPNGPGRPPWG